MNTIIEVNDLKKSFGSLPVLKGVNLSVSQGEIVSIVGASGAGKTTLLHIIGTIERPDSGFLKIEGQDVFGLNDRRLSAFRNQKIGFVFQFHHLLPEFNAVENVCLPAFIAGRPKKQTIEKAEQLLKRLGLGDRLTHKPSALSGGEQQRVAVARALINDPAVILADEPSGNLDSNNARELHQLFFDLRDEFNQTFVIITHNEELANLSDRKLVIKDGTI